MDLNDRIGRTEFVTKVKNIVNQLKPDNHICVAINGDWGSGKTFVMEMLDRSFTADRNCIVVRYDAWKNNFYSDPLIAILYCLLEGVEQYVSKLPEFVEKIKVGITETVKRIGSNILSAMAKSGGKLAVCAEVIRTIGSVATASIKITDNKNFDDFKSYQALLLQVQEQLNNLTAPSDNNDNVKLVVLVDELDRCLPNEQLIVLERLHHLFEVRNCAVIVALNQRCVIKTVQNMYGTSGHEYLRKFFDFTFKLPMSSDIYLKSILSDVISKGEKVNNKQSCLKAIEVAYNCLKYGSKNVLKKVDNRDLSRYYECLQSICNEFSWNKLNQYYLFFIVIALFIRKHVSKTFLNKSEIKEKQEVETQSNIYRTNDETSLYYNFFDQYIGEQSVQLQRSFIGLNVNEKLYPENFNAIVAKSVDSVVDLDSDIISSIKDEDCVKLRNLVLQYGGESEREDQ